MLPEWTLPYVNENYTGPFLSDGRFQSSVAHGKAPPRSELDRLSRDHDTAYALARGALDRRIADQKYYDQTRSMSWFPRLAGDIVLYGNDPARLIEVVPGFGVNMGNGQARSKRAQAQGLGNDSYKRLRGSEINSGKREYLDGGMSGSQPGPLPGQTTQYLTDGSYKASPPVQPDQGNMGGGAEVYWGRGRRRRRRRHL